MFTVDMEAATVFAVAEYRDVKAGAIFTVSDTLAEDGWDPHFHRLDGHLIDIFEIVLAISR